MTHVAATVRALNGDPDLGSVEDMDHYYAHLEHADLPRDCALVELDGRVVAYGRASWEQLANGERHVATVLFIEPSHRGVGVEELLIDHVLLRAGELIPEIGRDAVTRVQVFVTASDAEQRRALEGRGLRITGHGAQLVRPDFDGIPDLPLPVPYLVRPIGRDDKVMHRRVYDADARAFADSRGQEAPSDHQFESWLESPTFDPTLWRVAFDGDRIAGQILNYLGDLEPDGTRIGWTEAISVQPEDRRRGLARALLAESLRAVRDAGATSAALGVDLLNPNHAVDLYQGLGFRIVSEDLVYELGPFPPGSRPDLRELGAGGVTR